MGGGCCVGDFPIISSIVDGIGDVVSGIFCSDSCCVGNSPGPSDSEQHARKVANELAEMKERTRESSVKTEKNIMGYINSTMDSFMLEIDKLNKQTFYGEKLNINTEAIRDKNEKLNNQVVGCISNVMNTRLVQTDKELSTILEEKDDKKRKKNFERFVGRVKKDALGKLKVKIEKTVKAQSEVVSKEIKTRQKEVDAKMKESIKEMTEIMEIKEKSETELNKKQIEYMYQSSLCDIILAEVKGW